MKLEITTSPKNVEAANCILAQAIKAFRDSPDGWEFTEKELDAAEAFRRSVLKAFLTLPEMMSAIVALKKGL